MTNTLLPNKFKKYWIEDPEERHKNIIGEYHVSAVGCNHEDANNSGPCLRQTFYGYISPMELTNQTSGNFAQGRMMHKEAQRIYILNHPNAVAEFPLGMIHISHQKKIILLGSVDIVRFDFDGIAVIDFKTASDWTFPKDKDDKNPTHFDQVHIYTAWLINRVLDKKVLKVKSNGVVYFDKHNLYSGEQFEHYDKIVCLNKFADFIRRCWELHQHLLDKELPPKEPMKWCKFCDYRDRCEANVIYKEDVPEFTLEEVEKLYMKQTGKSAIWRGKYTKGFEIFKFRFKVKE